MTPYQKMHSEKGRKLRKLSWGLEIFVILTALGLAFTLLTGDATEQTSRSAIVIAGLPLVAAAAIELAKIPLAEAVIFARWYLKPVALVLLIGVAFSTFETLFQGFEHGSSIRIARVAEAQTNLTALESQLSSLRGARLHQEETLTRERSHVQQQISVLREQNEGLKADMEDVVSGASDSNAIALTRARDAASSELDAIRQERDAAVVNAGSAWQSESDQYQARIARGGDDGQYAARLQKAMPSKSTVMKRAEEEWNRSNSGRLQKVTTELDQINSQLKEYLQSGGVVDQERVSSLKELIDRNNLKISALTEQTSSRVLDEDGKDEADNIREMEEEILRATALVSLLAGDSNIYRFAGIVFGKPEAEVSIEEARTAAALFWGTLAAVLALGTSGLALIGAHHTALSLQKRSAREQRLLKWLKAQRKKDQRQRNAAATAGPALEFMTYERFVKEPVRAPGASPTHRTGELENAA